MTAKKTFIIAIRIFFILFSLHFIKIALFRWDGFSYYMGFTDFLPEVSLAFIAWTISSFIFSLGFWFVAFWVPAKIKLTNILKFEYTITLFILFAVFLFSQRKLVSIFSLPESISLTFIIIVTGFILSLSVLWIVSKFYSVENLLYGLNERITPLVWFFSFLFLISIVLLAIQVGPEKAEYTKPVSHARDDADNRPNIIMVTMDSLTARDMQVYGYERPTTPFLSEWAGGAITFDRMYAASNWTTPATMSLMTGQLPWTHKIWYEPQYHPVDTYENNLPKLLSDNGYKVYGFVQNNLAHPTTLGIANAFLKNDDAYTFLVSDKWWIPALTKFFVKRRVAAEMIIENNPLLKPINLKHSRHPSYMRFVIYQSIVRSETVYDRFFDEITDTAEEPFFAWLHVFPPHDLYLPPETYVGTFGDAKVYDTGNEQLDSNLLYMDYAPDEQGNVDILRKRYDEFVLYSDQAFRSFMKRLSDTIDMENTVVIVSSDHGEMFSHGYVAHNGTLLYEPLVHIPLIIKTPDLRGRRTISSPVSQIDIAPTILDLADISVPEWLEGRSLLPLIEGKSIDPKPVFSMQLIRNRAVGNYPITKGNIAVWDGDYKLIHDIEDNRSMLFNIINDPLEELNIENEKPVIKQKLLMLINKGLKKGYTKHAS